MNKLNELILKPEEIFYIGKTTGGKYLDYSYIAAMKELGARKKLKAQEILDGLCGKGYAEEDLLGNVEISSELLEFISPVYNGTYESELTVRYIDSEGVQYKFHQLDGRILAVKCMDQEYLITESGRQEIEEILKLYAGDADDPSDAAASVQLDQIGQLIILKGTRIGQDVSVFAYGKAGNAFYEPDPESSQEDTLRRIPKSDFYERAMRVLAGG